MTCTSRNNQKMSCRASAFCANAASFCANIAVVDAIFVASIIICALLGLFVLGISLVLLVVLLHLGKVNRFRAQKFLQAV